MTKPFIENPTPHAIYMREWRKNNPHHREDQKRWWDAHLATEEGAKENRDRASAWYYDNLESARAKAKEWKKNNPVRAKENAIDWRARNPEKVKINRHNVKARRRGAKGKYTQSNISEIFEQQNGKCAYWKVCQTKLGDDYHVDHVVPIAKGGSNWPSNLQLTCPDCNLRKCAKDPIDYAQEVGMLL